MTSRSQQYRRRGLCHRDNNLPACVWVTGTLQYYEDGKQTKAIYNDDKTTGEFGYKWGDRIDIPQALK